MSETCAKLHRIAHGLPRLCFPFDRSLIPRNGIYLLFEQGERGHGGDRIVRVGTHTGQGNLPSRLREHFLNENKDRSIFRKNIGRAILNRAGDPFLEKWELDLTTTTAKKRHAGAIDLDRQAEVERQVTEYIQARLSFVVLEVVNKEDRLALEAKMIATVSLCEECQPSATWLGGCSPKAKIGGSGLWLVNELYGKPVAADDLGELERLLRGRM